MPCGSAHNDINDSFDNKIVIVAKFYEVIICYGSCVKVLLLVVGCGLSVVPRHALVRGSIPRHKVDTSGEMPLHWCILGHS